VRAVVAPSSPTVAAPFAAPTVAPPAQPTFAPQTPDASRNGEPVQPDAGASTATSTDATRSAIGGGTPPDDRSSGVSIIPDEANNSLVITATSAEYKRMRQILQSIDVATAQVLLEATIAEVTLNDNLKFGLRYFLHKGGSNVTLTDSLTGAVAPVFPGFSYFLNLTNLQVVLNALNTITDVNIVSSPTLMVQENKRAVLQVGDEVPIATQSAVSVGAPGAPIVNSVSFRSTGVILGITPRVSDDGRVLLDIEQEVSGVIPTTSSNIDSPTIQQRRVKTTVTTKDGETLVLAGRMQDKATAFLSRSADRQHSADRQCVQEQTDTIVRPSC
jgi:general secretion pathway protein D